MKLVSVSNNMGSKKSKLLNAEKANWIKDHKLEVNHSLTEKQNELLDMFDGELFLCFQDQNKHGVQYQHWFVTDKTWYIEFGGGQTDNCSVNVHANAKTNYCVSQRFQLTDEVKKKNEEGLWDYKLLFNAS